MKTADKVEALAGAILRVAGSPVRTFETVVARSGVSMRSALRLMGNERNRAALLDRDRVGDLVANVEFYCSRGYVPSNNGPFGSRRQNWRRGHYDAARVYLVWK